jgi:hypothetical protein
LKPEFFFGRSGFLSHTVAYGGGDPSKINFASEIASALRQVPNLTRTMGTFTGTQPLLGSATGQAQNIAAGVPGLTSQLQGLVPTLQNQIPFYQGLAGPLQGQIGNIQSALNQINPTIASGGALTDPQRAQAIADFRAAGAGSGMNRTNPGIFATGMDVFNLEQNRFNTAYNQALAGAQGIQGLTGALGAIPQGIAGITSQLAGFPSQIQGLQTTGLNAALAGQQGLMNAWGDIWGPLLGARTQTSQANLQSAIGAQNAAQNKQAGIGSGALSGLGNIGSSAVLGSLLGGGGSGAGSLFGAAAAGV